MDVAIRSLNALKMAEKLNAIGNNTYISLTTMGTVIGFAVWFITFKVGTESRVERLEQNDLRIEKKIEAVQQALPTKDYLDLKFQNIQEKIEDLQKENK